MTSWTEGARIQRARLEAGLTQRALAEAVGVGWPYISKIENGHERPSTHLCVRLAEVLGIDLSTEEEKILAAAERLVVATMDDQFFDGYQLRGDAYPALEDLSVLLGRDRP